MLDVLCSWCYETGDLRVADDTTGSVWGGEWVDIACIDHVREYFSPNAIHPHKWAHVPVGTEWRGV